RVLGLRGHGRVVREDEVVTIDGDRHLVLGTGLGVERLIRSLTDLTRGDEVAVPDGAVLTGLAVPQVDDPRASVIRLLGTSDPHGVVLAGTGGVTLGDMLSDVVEQPHGEQRGLSSEELERILRRSDLLPNEIGRASCGAGVDGTVRAEGA